jgi:hypothetical protein
LTIFVQKGDKDAERDRSKIAELGLSSYKQRASDFDGSEDAFCTRLPAHYARLFLPFSPYL